VRNVRATSCTVRVKYAKARRKRRGRVIRVRVTGSLVTLTVGRAVFHPHTG
jgi:hypothetical protein